MLPKTSKCCTDDKYSKRTANPVMPCLLSSKFAGLDSLGLSGAWDVNGYLRKIQKIPFRHYFLAYICLLVVGFLVHGIMGGSFANEDVVGLLIDYGSAVFEALGLLSIRLKIESQSNVIGISGMTMCMYAFVYIFRFIVSASETHWDHPNAVAVQGLSFLSILMTLDIIKTVFKTYRESYQKDLDVLNVKYLVPACLALALVLRPDLGRGTIMTIGWISCLYLDVFALLPQVVMMSRGDGKVEAPIANFVAATALSRLVDLYYWIQGNHGLAQYSWMFLLFFHILHLALVADFIYYYLRARFSGNSVSEDLSLQEMI